MLWREPTGESARQAKKELRELEWKAKEQQLSTSEQARESQLTAQLPKWRRNRVYRICGRLILAWIILGWIQNYYPDQPTWRLFFACEWGALWTFAAAWIVKGQMLLMKDLAPGPQYNASRRSDPDVIRVRWS